jgi:hypothetical protein
MKKYLPLLLCLTVLCFGGVIYLYTRPCKSCDAVKVLSSRLGIEANTEVISKYFDEQIRVGQPREKVFAFLERAKPDVLVEVQLGNARDVPGSRCYAAKFDETTGGMLVFNRYFCFDGSGKVFYAVHELSLS